MFTNTISNAQCPAPSNVTIINYLLPEVTLGWTETGTTNIYDISIIPDYVIGATISDVTISNITTSPFSISSLSPQLGCIAFFVRSVCSPTEYSPWVGVASPGCSTSVINYLATNTNFSLNDTNNKLQISPNPTQGLITLDFGNKPEVVTVSVANTLGQEISRGVYAPAASLPIMIEGASGIYFVTVTSSRGSETFKVVKQ